MLAFIPLSCEREGLKVGSKKFTESIILGEMISVLVADTGARATHYRELGGTQLVFQALRNGDIDIYPEYTGTIRAEILAGRAVASDAEMRAALGDSAILSSPDSWRLDHPDERVASAFAANQLQYASSR